MIFFTKLSPFLLPYLPGYLFGVNVLYPGIMSQAYVKTLSCVVSIPKNLHTLDASFHDDVMWPDKAALALHSSLNLATELEIL